MHLNFILNALVFKDFKQKSKSVSEGMGCKLIGKLPLATLEKDLSGVPLKGGRSFREWDRK